MHTKSIRVAAAAATASLAIAIAGCSSGASAGGDASAAPEGDTAITLAQIPGWNDNIDMNSLYKYVLERNGYTVELQDLTEISTVYAGTARGDLDAFSGAPTTIHKQYFDEYSDQIEDLGAYFENAAIFIAVPDYVAGVESLEDLPAHAAEFDGKIYGIELGSGLVTTTQEKVFPDYGLDSSYTLQASSTTAMLAELKKATDAKEPIAVTIWSPYWPNSAYGLRKLEDPKDSYGGTYSIHSVANKDFIAEHPDVAEMMASLKLTDEQFNTLDDVVTNEADAAYSEEVIAAWFEENPELLEQLESFVKK